MLFGRFEGYPQIVYSGLVIVKAERCMGMERLNANDCNKAIVRGGRLRDRQIAKMLGIESPAFAQAND
jgi:hypothetical protein